MHFKTKEQYREFEINRLVWQETPAEKSATTTEKKEAQSDSADSTSPNSEKPLGQKVEDAKMDIIAKVGELLPKEDPDAHAIADKMTGRAHAQLDELLQAAETAKSKAGDNAENTEMQSGIQAIDTFIQNLHARLDAKAKEAFTKKDADVVISESGDVTGITPPKAPDAPEAEGTEKPSAEAIKTRINMVISHIFENPALRKAILPLLDAGGENDLARFTARILDTKKGQKIESALQAFVQNLNSQEVTELKDGKLSEETSQKLATILREKLAVDDVERPDKTEMALLRSFLEKAEGGKELLEAGGDDLISILSMYGDFDNVGGLHQMTGKDKKPLRTVQDIVACLPTSPRNLQKYYTDNVKKEGFSEAFKKVLGNELKTVEASRRFVEGVKDTDSLKGAEKKSGWEQIIGFFQALGMLQEAQKNGDHETITDLISILGKGNPIETMRKAQEEYGEKIDEVTDFRQLLTFHNDPRGEASKEFFGKDAKFLSSIKPAIREKMGKALGLNVESIDGYGSGFESTIRGTRGLDTYVVSIYEQGGQLMTSTDMVRVDEGVEDRTTVKEPTLFTADDFTLENLRTATMPNGTPPVKVATAEASKEEPPKEEPKAKEEKSKEESAPNPKR